VRLQGRIPIAATLEPTAVLAITPMGCSRGKTAAGCATVRATVQTIPVDYMWPAEDWGAMYKLRSTNSVRPSTAREVHQHFSGPVDTGSPRAPSAVARNPSKLRDLATPRVRLAQRAHDPEEQHGAEHRRSHGKEDCNTHRLRRCDRFLATSLCKPYVEGLIE
jgi:hypothetical protein